MDIIIKKDWSGRFKGRLEDKDGKAWAVGSGDTEAECRAELEAQVADAERLAAKEECPDCGATVTKKKRYHPERWVRVCECGWTDEDQHAVQRVRMATLRAVGAIRVSADDRGRHRDDEQGSDGFTPSRDC